MSERVSGAESNGSELSRIVSLQKRAHKEQRKKEELKDNTRLKDLDHRDRQMYSDITIAFSLSITSFHTSFAVAHHSST